MRQVITKDREKTVFLPKKIKRAILRCGGNEAMFNQVIQKIEKNFKNKLNITTKDIYTSVKQSLFEIDPKTALKYSLKEAMESLGPDGFCFEKYIHHCLKELNFKLTPNIYINGKATDYEMDFIAEKDNISYLGECKYKNSKDGKVDVNVVLIAYGSYIDITNNNTYSKENSKRIIITNTRFTSKAIAFAKEYDILLKGWNYPNDDGLETYIDRHLLYPITIFSKINSNTLHKLASENIILAKDFINIEIKSLSRKIHVPEKILAHIKKEANILFN